MPYDATAIENALVDLFWSFAGLCVLAFALIGLIMYVTRRSD